MFKGNIFSSKDIKVCLHTKLAAEAHLAERQFLIAGQTQNRGKSLRYRVGTRRPTVSRTDGQNLEPR
jgi:hypothetical protein